MVKAKQPSPERFDAIVAWLETFEQPGFQCGHWPESPPGVASNYKYQDTVTRFVKALHTNGWVVPFDWISWKDTAAQLVNSPALLASADEGTLRKLITTHIRQDRFCEGHLAAMFENGHFVQILQRLKKIREESGK